MDTKLKLMVLLGTRPEIIRLSRVLSRAEQVCDLVLVHTGQNYDYELNEVFFSDLRLRMPDYFLGCADSAGGAANTIGNIISRVDSVLDKVHPDALLVLGDTNSCLGVISAKRRKVPIFHMEAGNRCFDQRVPEEINRKIVDHVADVNLTYSKIARDYLLREGFPPDRVINIGSPMYEVLRYYIKDIENSDILAELELKPRRFFLVSSHREENVDDEKQFSKLISLLNWLASTFNWPVIVSTHPRTRRKIEESRCEFNPLVRLLPPQGFFSYVKLQSNARAVLSDSGTITEESSILGFPALNIREVHERPEGMERAAVMLVGLEITRIQQALQILEEQAGHSEHHNDYSVPDYEVPNVSNKVVRIIHSYTDFVNRRVWMKI